MRKRGEIAPKERFLLFSTLLYKYIFLTSGVKLHIHLLNVAVQFIVFLTLSTLICRGADISKCFSESLGIRDNESRLYMWYTVSRKRKAICAAGRHLLKKFIFDYFVQQGTVKPQGISSKYDILII